MGIALLESVVPGYVEEEEVVLSAAPTHSLHTLFQHPGQAPSALANHFIERYTERGETVLDPSAMFPTVGVEACRLGRPSILASDDPLCSAVAQRLLQPVDLAAVALYLQATTFERPISLSTFGDEFQAFYELSTFRSVYCLRSRLLEEYSVEASFMQVLAASILHGHTNNFLSAQTSPYSSCTPERQRHLNERRKVFPEARALAPRLLKKAALALRDGIPLRFDSAAAKSRIVASAANALRGVKNSETDLILCSSSALQHRAESQQHDQFWLRRWFLDAAPADVRSANDTFLDESLFELTRVASTSSRAVFWSRADEIETLDRVEERIRRDLSRFWYPERRVQLTANKKAPVRPKRLEAQKGKQELHHALVFRRL